MKKKVVKPFDIEAIKNGARAETNLGEEVEFVGECSNEEYPFVFYHNGLVGTYDINGRYNHDYDSKCDDIIIVEEVEEPRWADNKDARGETWYINDGRVAGVVPAPSYVKLNNKDNFDAFATKKHAKSALAMARISQLMKHDSRYGGIITDDEWKDKELDKYVIGRYDNNMEYSKKQSTYHLLAFHTSEQRDLFVSENKQLVKDYLMID